MFRVVVISCVTVLITGCLSTSTRDKPFTDEWADQVRGRPELDRRTGVEVKSEEPRRLGPATVTQDETVRPEVKIGGVKGLGADVQIKSGLSTRIRYNYHWDSVKPQRRR